MANWDKKIRYYSSRYGMLAHFNADKHIGMSLERYGEWAQAEIVDLLEWIPEGGVVVDIGAHIGTHTLPFARKVGNSGTVIAIEGQPEVATLLSASVVVNELYDRVSVLNALAGGEEGLWQHSYHKPEGTSNLGSVAFVEETDASGGLTTQIPIITLDSLNLTKCDLLKIDVEGMELEVFRGASRLLETLKPAIFYEQSSEEKFSEIRALLAGFGYRLFYHISNPFNTNNYFGSVENKFDGHVEVNILAIHSDSTIFPKDLVEICSDEYAPPRPTLKEGLKGVALVETDIDAGVRKENFTSIFRSLIDRFTEQHRSHEQTLKNRIADHAKEVKQLEARITDVQLEATQKDSLAQERLSEQQTKLDHLDAVEQRLDKEIAISIEKTRLVDTQASTLNSLQSKLEESSKESAELSNAAAAFAKENERLRRMLERGAQQAHLPRFGAVSDRRQTGVQLPASSQPESKNYVRIHDLMKVLRSDLFDHHWYRKQVSAALGRAPRGKISLARHYIARGWRMGFDPHPLFCSSWYLASHRDVRESGACPLVHYLTSGLNEGRDPHPLIAVDWYRDQNPDIGPMAPAQHFLKHGLHEGRDPHPLFSSNFYSSKYDDVESYAGGPFMHYLRHGTFEGRQPHPLFNPTWYRDRYSKCAKYHSNDLCDLIISAFDEERDPNSLFWSEWYRSQSAELTNSNMSAVMHYAAIGEHVGNWPNPIFDPKWYRQEAKIAGSLFALAHYMEHGAHQGLSPHPLFSPHWVSEQSNVELEDCLALYLKGEIQCDPHPLFENDCYMSNSGESFSYFYRSALSCYLHDKSPRKASANPFFDPEFYTREYPAVARDGHDPMTHYVIWGERDGWKPNRYFDPVWYQACHPNEVKRLGSALSVFSRFGAARLDQPSPMFHSEWLTRFLPNDRGVYREALSRAVTESSDQEIHPLFDSEWYRSTYLKDVETDLPILHYFEKGWKLGHAPNAYFDVEFYSDLAGIEDQNPLAHYVAFGEAKGLSFNPLMDPRWYSARNTGANEYPGGPLAHFVRVGDFRDKSPSPLFDSVFYRSTYPDVDEANESALYHYLKVGDREGRKPNAHFDPQWYRENYSPADNKRTTLAEFVGYGDFDGHTYSESEDGIQFAASTEPVAVNRGSSHEIPIVPVGPAVSRHFLVLYGSFADIKNQDKKLEKLNGSFDCIWIFDEGISDLTPIPSKFCSGLKLLSPENTSLETLFIEPRSTVLQRLAISTVEDLASRPDCKAITISAFSDVFAAIGSGNTVDIGEDPVSWIKSLAENDTIETLKPTRANIKMLASQGALALSTNDAQSQNENWTYSKYDNGERIEDTHRDLYRRLPILQHRFKDPFSTSGNGGFSRWVRNYLKGADTRIASESVSIPNSLLSKLI